LKYGRFYACINVEKNLNVVAKASFVYLSANEITLLITNHGYQSICMWCKHGQEYLSFSHYSMLFKVEMQKSNPYDY
jgi:hypothetical protein